MKKTKDQFENEKKQFNAMLYVAVFGLVVSVIMLIVALIWVIKYI